MHGYERIATPLVRALDTALNELALARHKQPHHSTPADLSDEYARAADDMAMVLHWERTVFEIESRELAMSPLEWALRQLSGDRHDDGCVSTNRSS